MGFYIRHFPQDHFLVFLLKFISARCYMGTMTEGWIFDIQRYSVNDGPGIRTTVFFKGCPLRCLWCDNPESQLMHPRLFCFEMLCVKCYKCVAACATGATTIGEDQSIKIDRGLCTACGACVKVCLSEARVISGRLMTSDEVVNVVKRDILFYRNSGGGVTASGGEPTYQPDFLFEIFQKCQQAGLHTALDTSGYVRWETLRRILGCVDLVLFDIKHMDPLRHRELTGVDNKLILENIRKISNEGVPLIARVPLIPGWNDSEENIKSTAELLTQLRIVRVDILPYHQFGMRKYERLGIIFKLNAVQPYTEEQVEAIKKSLEAYGLETAIA